MKKIEKIVPLESMETVSGKKVNRYIIYSYLDFNFKVHRIGDNATGKAMYKVTPVNFDCRLLRSFSQKTEVVKGFAILQLNNLTQELKFMFDEISRIKKKKEMARLAYEKALKNGTLPVKEEEPVVVKAKHSESNHKSYNKRPNNGSKFGDRTSDSDRSNYDRENRFSKPKSNGYKKNDRNDSYSKPKSDGYKKNDRNDGYSKPKSDGYKKNDRNDNYSKPKSDGYKKNDRNDNYSKPKSDGYKKNDRNDNYSKPKSDGYKKNDRNDNYSKPKSDGYKKNDRNDGYSKSKSTGFKKKSDKPTTYSKPKSFGRPNTKKK